MACRLDVVRTADWTEAVDAIMARFGRIDILVNNAGGMVPGEDLVDMTDDDWNYMVRVNVDGVFFGCRSVAPVMIRQASGTIVNIASIFAEQPQTTLLSVLRQQGGGEGVVPVTRAGTCIPQHHRERSLSWLHRVRNVPQRNEVACR